MEARRRLEAGQQISEADADALTDYYRKYTPQKVSIHVKAGRDQQWRELAMRQGLSLSAWVQERVVQALQGPGEAVGELRTENQRLRDEVGALRGTSGHLAVENSKLQSRLEALEGSLMEAMEHALKLAGDEP